jgi:hypothetical protein
MKRELDNFYVFEMPPIGPRHLTWLRHIFQPVLYEQDADQQEFHPPGFITEGTPPERTAISQNRNAIYIRYMLDIYIGLVG